MQTFTDNVAMVSMRETLSSGNLNNTHAHPTTDWIKYVVFHHHYPSTRKTGLVFGLQVQT
jgi:hypothetical protein